MLILDRGYPAAWLVAYLTEQNIRFFMRCEKSTGSWAAVRAFAHSDQVDAMVTLNKPNKWDCEDLWLLWCGATGALGQMRDTRWTDSRDGDQFANQPVPDSRFW